MMPDTRQINSDKTTGARHTHICPNCQFLGHYDTPEREYDLYCCFGFSLFWETFVVYDLIARYGSRTAECLHGLENVGKEPILTQAAEWAIQKSMLPTSQKKGFPDGLTAAQTIQRYHDRT